MHQAETAENHWIKKKLDKKNSTKQNTPTPKKNIQKEKPGFQTKRATYKNKKLAVLQKDWHMEHGQTTVWTRLTIVLA